ncbi:regulatory signaling modulator protein AmpE [Glaciecola petra]|uniref:Regulatory signaling modulator protein AmpE n=1 Tax=Glaciecola petra TaxID=3075602 RepID=A0ABU2ZLL4_9ALTE|nr:regulatory signaling modulator protein AmpE [Aestuariibacter sp. P117]MDT0593518.1 regulatory signaling modulator protein AmpE [Aestuariibacter sp. P117]
MTLFTLLIIMALERVSNKSKEFHITSIARKYFALLTSKSKIDISQPNLVGIIIIAGIPALIMWILVVNLTGLLVFILYLLSLWICLGCPVTRKTFKRYLQSANKEDFEACSLHSISLGNVDGELSNVGKQLILVNYRQYASVILFFIFLGLPGMVFYSLIKELKSNQIEEALDNIENDAEAQESANQTRNTLDEVLFILDWIPARLTAFGYLIVGHFSNGLVAWMDVIFNVNLPIYDLLAKVAKASEEHKETQNIYLTEPLQMVKLAKRNIIFILMGLSIGTLVGVVA